MVSATSGALPVAKYGCLRTRLRRAREKAEIRKRNRVFIQLRGAGHLPVCQGARMENSFGADRSRTGGRRNRPGRIQGAAGVRSGLETGTTGILGELARGMRAG